MGYLTAYLVAVVVIFSVWHRAQGTLSLSAITTRPREAFYWAAVLAIFALGTAVSDLTAFARSWSALASSTILAVLIARPRARRHATIPSRAARN